MAVIDMDRGAASGLAPESLKAADGTPLKKRLAKALFVSRLRAFGLVTPLLFFLVVFFLFPILVFMKQGIYNDDYESAMPRTAAMMTEWDGKTEPDEPYYAAVVADIIHSMATDRPLPTKAATRLNREESGATSMTKRLIRQIGKFELTYAGEEMRFTALLRELEKEDEAGDPVYARTDRSEIGAAAAEEALQKYAPFQEMVVKADKKWADIKYWYAMQRASQSLTGSFVLKAVDLQIDNEGSLAWQPEERQIHLTLFMRTLEISLIVAVLTFLLGYPVAYILATLPARQANLLLILVLLPFWTSILVRTTAWIAMLQGQGVLNDLAVFIGLTPDDARFSMIYNKTGTIIAMTHILLPFMILPLYSVMKAIPPQYVRAAKSLGATNWTAFWRVYFPQTVPGIGAGAILVFILAIGYYITPALLGGSDGVMISNIIDGHMRSTLNYSLAAALGLVLLVFVLICYWIYDRVVGIDNMKLG
ncbi:MAG: ABC transporter permease [Pseudomonadota bacterium]